MRNAEENERGPYYRTHDYVLGFHRLLLIQTGCSLASGGSVIEGRCNSQGRGLTRPSAAVSAVQKV